MSTTSTLRTKGLNTYLNYYSAIPEGSLFEAYNVVIDRDGIIEPRRGKKVLSDIPALSKQLFTYKNAVLVHYLSTIAFYNGTDFTPYRGKTDFIASSTTVNTSTDTFNITLTDFSNEDAITFVGSNLPAPLVSGNVYYAQNVTQSGFQLSLTPSGSVIDITSIGSGTVTMEYNYIFTETQAGLRIKSFELNGNRYITTATGIKKLYGLNEFFVTDAGGIKALDLDLELDLTTTVGFLDNNKEVAYRVVWGTNDINGNLILGTPSYRAVIFNNTGTSRNVTVKFNVPFGVTTDYFYQIYRTDQADANGSGDEMRQVFEAPYDGTSTTISVLDDTPESIRDAGTNLYTNESSGEGILQANDKPPISKDVAIYKNYAWYANTTSNQTLNFTLLGRDNLSNLVPGSIASVALSGGNTIFTFNSPGHGIAANQDVVLLGTTDSQDGTYSATYISATQFSLPGNFMGINIAKTSVYTSYVIITKAGVSNKYYFVGRPEINDLTITYAGQAIAGKYFTINSANDIIPYYVWYNDTTAATPTTDPAPSNLVGIKVDYAGGGVAPDTTSSLAQLTATALDTTGYFVSTVSGSDISVSTADNGPSTNPTAGNLNGTGIAQQVQVTVGSNGPTVAGEYFLIYPTHNTPSGYYVWLNDTGASTTDPAPAGFTGIQVNYVGTAVVPDTISIIATNIASAISAVSASFSATSSSSVVTINNTTIGTANSPSLGTFTPPWTISKTITGQDTTTAWSWVNIQDGFGEDVTKNYVNLSSSISTGTGIEVTAKSLAKNINFNPNEVVAAYYTSSGILLPGAITLENKKLDNVPFTIQANDATTGSAFNPNLTSAVSSTSDSFPNKLYFSKQNQPEAVPATNSFLVGPKDKAILRIIGLRDSLFIFKEEGIYRLYGDDVNSFNIVLFDNSTDLIAADSASVLNNQIYGLTSQGIASVSETGVGIISRPIEDVFIKATSPAYTTFKTAIFGLGYESDRAYSIFIQENPNDATSTIAYRYNTFTQSWTAAYVMPATCATIETTGNKIYFGAGDIDAVEVERKTFTSRDYADREYSRFINIYDSDFIYVDDASQMEIGDVLTQTQYVTASQYNRIIKKIKNDPLLNIHDTSSLTEMVSGDDTRAKIQTLVAFLVTYAPLQTINYTNGNVDVPNSKFIIVNHGLSNGDVLQFTGTPPTPLVTGTNYFVVNVTQNDFQVSATMGGSPITFTTTGSGSMTLQYYFVVNQDDFAEIQTLFNYNITQLNTSDGAFFSDYALSEGAVYFDLLITKVEVGQNRIQVANIPPFAIGPAVHAKAIKSKFSYAPWSLGEATFLKQVREGVFHVETDSLATVTIGYASDLSGNFEDVPFNLYGSGNWGASVYSGNAWGGNGIAIPLRTYIPRQKQRCRYMKARFIHSNAFFKYSVLGIAYTYNNTSERVYRL